MKNGIKNINKDLIKRKKYLKCEIRKIILKSILKNKNLKPLIRAGALFRLSCFSLNQSISRQNNNICLKTGRVGGVYNTFNYSRHYIKKLGINNDLQNYKITGW